MRINVTSLCVDDQRAALAFYRDVLGFPVLLDEPVGNGFSVITLASPGGPEGVALMLEPRDNPAAKTYYDALYAQGIPATSFASDDCGAEHSALVAKGVRFTQAPEVTPWGTVAIFDDTVGNLIQLHQELTV
jgi:predicted enzyme related to lactoylglutathione lyase